MLTVGMYLADRYEIINKVGAGGMSDVYKAMDHILGRNVAIKVLKQEFSEDRTFVTKFRTEAQSAAGLEHPNIVNIYDVGSEEGMYYIVMEYVEGITLKTYIEKKEQLTFKEAISIAIQVARGIEAAHNKDIIHRDIKPQNIIISTEGKVKVTDFGIARAASSNTISSDVMGSVHYASPEQARNGAVDIRSDIYSLGIVMYEMITGRVPFDGDTTVAVAIQHLQDEMANPSVYAPNLPISLEKIIMKCSQKSPERRYQNMGELLGDLRKSLLSPNEDFVYIAPIAVDPNKTKVISQAEISQINESVATDATTVIGTPQGQTVATQTVTSQTITPVTAEQPTTVMPSASQMAAETETKNIDLAQTQVMTPTGAKENDLATTHTETTTVKKKKEAPIAVEEEDEDGILNPKMDKVVTIMGIVVAAIIVIVIVFFLISIPGLFRFGNKPNKNNSESQSQTQTESQLDVADVAMIKVVGMTQEAAQLALSEAGFTMQVTEIVESDQKEGTVLTQSIEEGAMVATGSNVQVTVSGGKAVEETFEIPKVVGNTENAAVNSLTQLELSVEKEYEYSDTVAAGVVIAVSPTEGSAVTKGTKVKLTLSQGKKSVSVVSVVGKEESVGKAELEAAGLTVVVEKDYSDSYAAGTIMKQSVAGGKTVASGTQVTITVSGGEATKYYNCNYPLTIPENAVKADIELKDDAGNVLLSWKQQNVVGGGDPLTISKSGIENSSKGTISVVWYGSETDEDGNYKTIGNFSESVSFTKQ